MKFVLHAANVHQGGGLTLLNAILRAISASHVCVALLDERCRVGKEAPSAIVVQHVRPTLVGRLLNEWRLFQLVGQNDVVLCFGNLPPLLRLSGHTVLFLQNRLLIDPAMPLGAYGLAVRARIKLERLWLRLALRHVDRVVVQTHTMRALLKRHLGRTADVLPFVPENLCTPPGDVAECRAIEFDFIYVSSGEPHKNHAVLLEAWRLLAEGGLRPSLALTLCPTRDSAVYDRASTLAAETGLKIVMLPPVAPEHICMLYQRCGALVFPSTAESFGLPLVEAAAAGLPIIAPECDYVRDVADPVQTFDPSSPVSLLRAIRRHLGAPEQSARLLTAAAFVEDVMRGGHVAEGLPPLSRSGKALQGRH